MDVRVGLWRRLSTKELMLLNCGVGEDSWESLQLQGDPTCPSEGDQPWDFFGRNDAKAETPVLWPPHAKCWLIGKDSDAGRDWEQEEKGTTEARWLMAPLTQWTWVWVNSRSWWWTGRPGVLQFMGLQRVGHNWVTELNWTDLFQHGSLQFKNFRCSILFDAYHCHISESSSVVFDSLQLMNYTIHGIVQARILEWVAVLFSRVSSQPRHRTQVSCNVSKLFTNWASGKHLL